MHVRVCPECDEEFRPEIVHCSDCGALLEDRFDDEEAAVTGNASAVDYGPLAVGPGTEGTYVRVFRADRAAEVEPLAVLLGRAGIPFHVRGAQLSFELLTRAEDHESVVRVLGDLLTGGPASAGEFDPEAGYATCPACGGTLPERVDECPECGLAMGGGEPPAADEEH
jgi:hypothetical protein